MLKKSLYLFVASLFLSQTAAVISQQVPQTPNPKVQKKDEKSVTGQKIKRWFEFDGFTISPRYRLIRNNRDQTTANQLQFQVNMRAHFNFDKKGQYRVHAGLFTGNNITGGWNNTGLGTGAGQSNLYLKQLYFAAKPVKELEIQIGGLGINNGENTEVTGYDNDAYMTGERISVRAPKHIYFDEVSFANGYVGDANKPSVFKRFHRLNESNYHQILVRKSVNKYVSFSADYTFEAGKDTLRQAIKFKLPKGKALDSFLFENYQRIDPTTGYGFGFYGDKTLHPRFTLGGGFSHIDRPMLNGDRYAPGNRLFANAVLKISPEFTLNGFLIHGVGSLPSPTSVRTRFDLIFSYNVLATLKRLKLQ